MPYKQQKVTAYSSGGWKTEIRVQGWSGEGPLWDTNFSLCPYMVEGAKELCWGLFYEK